MCSPNHSISKLNASLVHSLASLYDFGFKLESDATSNSNLKYYLHSEPLPHVPLLLKKHIILPSMWHFQKTLIV